METQDIEFLYLIGAIQMVNETKIGPCVKNGNLHGKKKIVLVGEYYCIEH